jgi:dUTP pyrophosphatase
MIPDVRIGFVRTGKVQVPLPKYQTEGSAGMDLHAAIERPITIPAGSRGKVPTGLIFVIPLQYEGKFARAPGSLRKPASRS